MSSIRILRSSIVHHIQTRGLSAEPAVAAFQPRKLAVRTSENDPTHHTKDDIGKLYTMPDEVRKRLFPVKYTLPMYYDQLCEVFYEYTIIVREPAVEVIDFIKRADYNKPIIRYLLYGRFGAGKSITVAHLLHYATNNDFIIVYAPMVWRWFHWDFEVTPSEEDPDMLELPSSGASFLRLFSNINSALITRLDLRTSKEYVWSQREQTPAGVSLNELVDHGINRIKFSNRVIDVLFQELKQFSRDNKCKTMVALDGYNGFFQTTSRLKLKDDKRQRMNPSKVSLTKSFLNLVNNDWNNGVAVLVADDHACVKDTFTSPYPFHLLRKTGIESIDPFIPIHVPEYSPLEFQNYLDYLEEKRWLQRPEARHEIEFITQRIPRLVNTYCANR